MTAGEVCVPHAAIEPRRPGKICFVRLSSGEELKEVARASDGAQAMLKTRRSRLEAAVLRRI